MPLFVAAWLPVLQIAGGSWRRSCMSWRLPAEARPLPPPPPLCRYRVQTCPHMATWTTQLPSSGFQVAKGKWRAGSDRHVGSPYPHPPSQCHRHCRHNGQAMDHQVLNRGIPRGCTSCCCMRAASSGTVGVWSVFRGIPSVVPPGSALPVRKGRQPQLAPLAPACLHFRALTAPLGPPSLPS